MANVAARLFVILLCTFPLSALALDMQRCNGRVLRVGEWESQADSLCGQPFYVDRWTEVRYTRLDVQRSLRELVDWNERYYDPGEGRILFRVRSRQGQIVAIETLPRRGGAAVPADCTIASLKRQQSAGEVVHRCGLPAQRIDLARSLIDDEAPLGHAMPLRHEQWLYPASAGQTLVVELREGRLRLATIR